MYMPYSPTALPKKQQKLPVWVNRRVVCKNRMLDA
jgi:hypothetical protein